jgi:uncharacterized cupredoxin-like copper-binding protein
MLTSRSDFRGTVPPVRRRTVRYSPLVLCFALMLVVGACSKSASSSPQGGGSSPSTTAPTTSSTTQAGTTAGIPVYDVFVKNFTYHGMPKTVPAGTPFMVSFTNKESFQIQHEFVVLKLTGGKTAKDVIADAKKKGPDAEDDWIHVGDSGDPLDTGASADVTMDLAPGNYVATCWQTGKAGGGSGPPHVTIGMIAPFKATASAPAPTASALPNYDVSVKNFTYHGAPKTVPANSPFLVTFTNKESFQIVHEFVVLKLPAGKTAKDVLADAKKKGPKAEDDWIHVGDSGDIDTGSSVTLAMDLPPGHYVATCWQTGKAGGGSGPPHLTIGMIAPFTASTGASTPATVAPVSYNVSVKNFTYHGMPGQVPANTPIFVSFVNKESFQIQHEFVVLKLTGGKTAKDVVADAKKKGPDAEDDWIHVADSGDPLDTNSGTVIRMDLPPGTYVATCWQTGKAGGGSGPPHVTIGMIKEFKAS